MSKKSETPRDIRKKLVRANTSRTALKDKNRDKQYEIKKLKICLSSMEVSRDQWRNECKKNMILVENLSQELSEVTLSYKTIVAKSENIESSKKTK